MKKAPVRISIEVEDALRFRADVLVLKHAQELYGVDAAVLRRLNEVGVRPALPERNAHSLVQTGRALGVDRVLFLGVEPLHEFGYAQIREFGRRALAALTGERGSYKRVALTIHGPGYGLDEVEAFESELAGLVDALAEGTYPNELAEVIFVERSGGRAQRLSETLERLLPTGSFDVSARGELTSVPSSARQTLRTAGYGSASKARVFVAMPFSEEMSDVFHYGIQGAVNAAGLLAERADLAAFTGDVMQWVRDRIAGAHLVVADLTGSNPNVYLEVGYAWGRGIATVLLVRGTADLKFDVRGQRCIAYGSIKDLETKLSDELRALQTART
jgi:hypothetical protein